MRFVGIDYSMTSPAMCIAGKDSLAFESCEVYYLTSQKKFIGKFGNVIGTEMPDWTSPEQRFDLISEHFVKLLLSSDLVLVEDYAFGAKGQVFHIGENTGLLKHKMYQRRISFDTIAPTALKKFATGKGNADKARMNEAFEEQTNFSVRKKLNCSENQWNPASDIVDAYFLCAKKVSGA